MFLTNWNRTCKKNWSHFLFSYNAQNMLAFVVCTDIYKQKVSCKYLAWHTSSDIWTVNSYKIILVKKHMRKQKTWIKKMQEKQVILTKLGGGFSPQGDMSNLPCLMTDDAPTYYYLHINICFSCILENNGLYFSKYYYILIHSCRIMNLLIYL